MALFWKVLAAMFLTLPAGAYYVGTVVGPYERATPSAPSATSPQTSRVPRSDAPALAPPPGSDPAVLPPQDTGVGGWGSAGGDSTAPATDGRTQADEGESFGGDAPLSQAPTGASTEPPTESPSQSPSETPSPSDEPSDATGTDPSGTPSSTTPDDSGSLPPEDPATEGAQTDSPSFSDEGFGQSNF